MLLALSACSDKHSSIGHFIPLDPEGWAYGDTVSFKVEGLDSLPPQQTRRLKIGVKHDNDYAYRNLILEVTYSDGHRTHRDTVDMPLADKYGAWHGSGIGPFYQAETVVSQNAPIPDSSTVTVRHIMRLDTVAGIQQIGIIIDKP